MYLVLWIFGLLIAALLYEIYEKKSLKKTQYSLESEKIQTELTAAVIADLHGYKTDRSNRILADKLLREKPDLVLIPGDLISRSNPSTRQTALDLLQQLAKQVPVYMSLGNHESALWEKRSNDPQIREFIELLASAGVRILDNCSEVVHTDTEHLRLYGLTLPSCFYQRFGAPVPQKVDVTAALSECERTDAFTILLAHTPAGKEAYFAWGADLILCGHYHGGVVRFGHKGLITPQLQLFAPHVHGLFTEDGHHMVVTSGLGVHAIPFRIFNRPEYVIVRIRPKQES